MIVEAFPTSGPKSGTSHPCHRIVLDLTTCAPPFDGIPTTARIEVGEGQTSSYTLSLFNLADSRRDPRLGDLVQALDGADAGWRRQLDRRFVAALHQELFSPTTATLRRGSRVDGSAMKPMLYRLVRAPRHRSR